MKQLRIIVLLGTLLIFLYLVNTGIMSSEQNIENGTLAYFELAPVDPRSLMQGDYMQLTYTIERDANDAGLRDIRRGQLVLYIDEQQIAHFSRLYHEGDTLEENEIIVNFYSLDWSGLRVGVDSFLFQEGLANIYANAKYAEVRIIEGADVMLIELVGENLEPLLP
jgi:uncharacterized membrane-anchored protein